MEPITNRISILIIDDSAGDQVLLEAHLENTSLPIGKIRAASTIAEGIACLQEEKFSLIFLDFFLPDSNGLESYIELTKVNSCIPVILLSGLSDTALSLKAISMGAQDFLVKGSYDRQTLEKSVSYSIERKKNIELLKENNERYDTISRATSDIIWDWDMITNKVKWVGQGLKNYLPVNFAGDQVPDRFWANCLHPQEKKKVIEGLYSTLAAGENSWESDYRFRRNDGSYAYINSRGYVLRNDQQKPVRMIGSLQDITDRKNAEIEMQKARFEAEEARKTQEQFLANMSHEIRTPMNGVIGMTELLASTELTREQKDYVATIQESSSNLMVIINDILDLTKIVAGKINILQNDYVLHEVVLNCIRINQPRADEKGIAIKSSIDPKIPVVLSGDPGRLSQVLINLVGNAVKFTHSGEVNIRVEIAKEDGESLTLQFAIEDTGIGIEADKMQAVFERFMQVSGDSTRKYGGTGLGLTITRQLVELMGGSIEVTSEKDKGSIFTCYLPLKRGNSMQEEVRPKVRQTPGSLNGVKILLVEDNLINQKVAVKTLAGMGAVVDVANNGKEAVEMLRPNCFDVVLMDIQMPEMDGYEATRIIRTDERPDVNKMPIIAMTASALISDRQKCLTAGMSDYIAKPYKSQELYDKIISQLNA